MSDIILRSAQAQSYFDMGLVPIPLHLKNKPAIRWGGINVTTEHLKDWYENRQFPGIGILCGSVSKNLEILDFESEEIYRRWLEKVESQGLTALVETMPLVKTPRGYHLYYRTIEKNFSSTKLAKDAEGNLLIETRGEGAYVMAPGSDPKCHPSNKSYSFNRSINNLPILNSVLRSQLIELARAFDQPAAKRDLHLSALQHDPVISTFDKSSDYSFLADHGFKLMRKVGEETYWQKPNSSDKDAHHVTTNYAGDNMLRCFSDACPPLQKKTYSAFEAYSLLNCSGNFSDARQELRLRGYECWNEPQLVESVLPPVSTMPMEMLPVPLRPWVSDISKLMSCPPETFAVAFMVMFSSLVGADCAIQPKKNDDSWSVVPNLWGAIVARPGMMKTPVLTKSTEFLNPLEAEAGKNYNSTLTEYTTKLEVFKAKKQALLKKIASGHAEDSELSSLKEPTKPELKRYKTNDTTTEKIVELLSANQRGMLYIRDELTGFFESLKKEGRQEDRGFWLDAWNGNKAYTQDRVGRGTIYCPSLCVSIFGCIQPDILRSQLTKSQLGEDGMIQRFQLLVFPDWSDYVYIDEKPGSFSEIHDIIKFVAGANFTGLGATVGGDRPIFKFSNEAQPIFDKWICEHQNSIGKLTDYRMAEHLSKYRSLMPSLALLFHLIDLAQGCAPNGPVSKASAELAVAWCKYLEAHAWRTYALAGSANRTAVTLLSEKIKNSELHDGFSCRDVVRHNWSGLTDQSVIRDALAELCSLDWLFEEVRPGGFQSKPTSKFWINPQCQHCQ